MPLFEAPSISKTSRFLPSVISCHDVQLLQGLPSDALEQLRVFAIIRAVVVLPTPLGPVKTYP